MKWSVHQLAACRPQPLGSYLKALAVLRIVGEQKDPGARGYWKDDCFHLATVLDEAALEHFFLHDWAPMPMVSPWNNDSSFSKASKSYVHIPLEQSRAPRFEAIRAAIKEARAAREATPIKQKSKLLSECHRQWRGGALRWLRAAVVLHGADNPTYPALLGTGGCDARLEFTNNLFQRLGDLFDVASETGGPREGVHDLLRASLWGTAALGRCKGAIGQFAPADSGGANATSGALGDSRLNPWDLVLLMEGAVLFSSASTRRLAAGGRALAAAPFAVRAQASGYGSASAKEADLDARGEQWMPLWERRWTMGELVSVLAEGRCQVNARPSENASDVVRAIARLGVARGVSSFERYGYLKRNGKSNYAVPLGRWEVRTEPHAGLLDDLDADGWWSRVRRAARDEHAPASFVRAERVLADSVMSALAHESQPQRWAAVLVALAALEHQMVLSGGFTVKKGLRPLPTLSPEWIGACDDGRPELRLALALAGASGSERLARGDGGGSWGDSVRSHWLPLVPGDRRRFPARFEAGERALARDPRVVCGGRDPESDLIAIVQRRLLEGALKPSQGLPLQAAPYTSADGRDLGALVDGSADLHRTLWLSRALSAVDFRRLARAHAPQVPSGPRDLDPLHLALRLVHLPFPVETHGSRVSIPVDQSPLRLLGAGEAARAFAVIAVRLRSSGLHVPFYAAALHPRASRLLAASLAFPISPRTARSFVKDLEHPSHKEHAHAH